MGSILRKNCSYNRKGQQITITRQNSFVFNIDSPMILSRKLNYTLGLIFLLVVGWFLPEVAAPNPNETIRSSGVVAWGAKLICSITNY